MSAALCRRVVKSCRSHAGFARGVRRIFRLPKSSSQLHLGVKRKIGTLAWLNKARLRHLYHHAYPCAPDATSRKTKSVERSTAVAELQALSDAMAEAIWRRRLKTSFRDEEEYD